MHRTSCCTYTRTGNAGLALAAVLAALASCKSGRDSTPPPDVRRPQIRSEAELAAERAARVAAGEIVATTSPTLTGLERGSAAARRPRVQPQLEPVPGAIEADILLVNSTVLTVPEVLYPLRGDLETLRHSRTKSGFREEARRLVRRKTQEEIGTILIYAEAVAALKDEQRKTMDAAIDKELENRVAQEFEGSEARLEAHLRAYGLTKDQLRNQLGRHLVVRQYTREKLMPQVQLRRDELLAFYRENQPRYTTTAARELLLIELPYEKFLPADRTWDRATPAERAQARLKAMRRAREAHAALAERSFAEVSAEFSLGPHAADGGSFGLLSRPLQPPHDVTSKLIFEYQEGQTSDPIETDTGWYIVRCGRIQSEAVRPFVEVQEEIRSELMEKRFSRLSVDYMVRLAEKATISPIEPFVNAAVEAADRVTTAAAGVR